MPDHKREFLFYLNLPAFDNFSAVSESQMFAKVPSDWTLVLSDIKGSTKAIQSGQYKNVNLIGAATITAFINVAGSTEVPFVFGGDGATLLVPNTLLAPLLDELRRLKRMAQEEFNIDLRVSSVPLSLLNEMQHDVFIAKFQLSPQHSLAQFRGGGLSFAEYLMKSNDPRVQHIEKAEDELYRKTTHPLDGLSCRLTPLRSLRGEMLTVLCKPKGDSTQQGEILKDVISQLSQILNQNFTNASPVNLNNLSWPLVPHTVTAEAKLRMSGNFMFRWLFSCVSSLVANLSLNFNFPLGSFKPEKYKKEVILNSDSKKFDETLRMVLDCSPEEIIQIRHLLENFHRENKVIFGLHKSAHALMTCVAKDPSNNGHIHFIDGADGGYAMAALQLKKQMQN